MSRELGVSDARVRTLRTLLGDAVPGFRIGLKQKATKKTNAYTVSLRTSSKKKATKKTKACRKGRPKQL
jgi:hypothetical protein